MRNRFEGNSRVQPLVAVMAAGLLMAGLAGCGHGVQAETSVSTKKEEPPVIKAVVLTVENHPSPAIVRTQGSLIADDVTIVGAKVAGRVNQITADLGDVVTANTPLASLDQEDYKLQISLAEAQLVQSRAALGLKPGEPVASLNPLNAPPVREAKAVWDECRLKIDRIRQLRIRNAVTQDELDTAVSAEGVADAKYGSAVNGVLEKIAQISVREAELLVAKQHLDETVIRAPFDGLISERHVARGSFVQVGEPLVTLVRTHPVKRGEQTVQAIALRFRGTMPERNSHRLALGQQLNLKIEGIAQPQTATITRISPSVDEMSRSLVFEAAVESDDGTLRTGLFAEAEVVVDPNARALAIPASAIAEFAGAEKVWKIEGGVAHEQLVETNHRSDDEIEIVKGLKAGDQILAKASLGREARVEAIADESKQFATNKPIETASPPTSEGITPTTAASAEPPTADHPVER
jgi:membrane fusion protein, multidrug efflux system